MIFLRRGYGAFVQCKNMSKAYDKAKHWKDNGLGDLGRCHPVISIFIAKSKYDIVNGRHQKQIVLYGQEVHDDLKANPPEIIKRIAGGVLMPAQKPVLTEIRNNDTTELKVHA